jgi:hypothetical protein
MTCRHHHRTHQLYSQQKLDVLSHFKQRYQKKTIFFFKGKSFRCMVHYSTLCFSSHVAVQCTYPERKTAEHTSVCADAKRTQSSTVLSYVNPVTYLNPNPRNVVLTMNSICNLSAGSVEHCRFIFLTDSIPVGRTCTLAQWYQKKTNLFISQFVLVHGRLFRPGFPPLMLLCNLNRQNTKELSHNGACRRATGT